MAKIKIATAFINTVKIIANHFKVAESDAKTGIKHWRDELDYSIEGKPAGVTNDYVTDALGKPLQVLEYDLSKIERRDAKQGDEVSVYDFIVALSKSAKKKIDAGLIKIILTDEVKEGVIKAIKEELIIKDNNLITEQSLVREEIRVIPTLDLNDEEITGMKDIKTKIANSKKELEVKELNSIDDKLKA